jgi:hypothetical protein
MALVSAFFLSGRANVSAEDVVAVLDFDVLGHSFSPLGNLLCTLASQRGDDIDLGVGESPRSARALSSAAPALARASARRPAAVSHNRQARPSSGSARLSINPASTARSTNPLMPGMPRSSAAPASPISTPSRRPSTNQQSGLRRGNAAVRRLRCHEALQAALRHIEQKINRAIQGLIHQLGAHPISSHAKLLHQPDRGCHARLHDGRNCNHT